MKPRALLSALFSLPFCLALVATLALFLGAILGYDQLSRRELSLLRRQCSAEQVALAGYGDLPRQIEAYIQTRSDLERRLAATDDLQTRGLVSPRVFGDLRDLVTVR